MMGMTDQQIEGSTIYSMVVIERELEVILNAMKTLSGIFPLSGAYTRLSVMHCTHFFLQVIMP